MGGRCISNSSTASAKTPRQKSRHVQRREGALWLTVKKVKERVVGGEFREAVETF